MSDISFSTMVQNLLSKSGYATDSISTDEDGNSHRIEFQASANKGIIYTNAGNIVMIEAEQI